MSWCQDHGPKFLQRVLLPVWKKGCIVKTSVHLRLQLSAEDDITGENSSLLQIAVDSSGPSGPISFQEPLEWDEEVATSRKLADMRYVNDVTATEEKEVEPVEEQPEPIPTRNEVTSAVHRITEALNSANTDEGRYWLISSLMNLVACYTKCTPWQVPVTSSFRPVWTDLCYNVYNEALITFPIVFVTLTRLLRAHLI